jgi:hypothetical protein
MFSYTDCYLKSAALFVLPKLPVPRKPNTGLIFHIFCIVPYRNCSTNVR